MSDTRIEYALGTLNVEELRVAVRAVALELNKDDSHSWRTDNDIAEGAFQPEQIELTNGSSGMDPATATIVVAFLSKPAYDIWVHLILPRILKRWGPDAIGPRKSK